MPEPSNKTQACTILNQKLTQVSIEESECSIYRVHTQLRSVNPNAYEPQIVSIGPYHHGKDDLKMMEDHKLRYLNLLIKRKNESNVERYVSAVEKLESKARKCYAEHISLSKSQFISMLVLDGCFIIELIRKFTKEQWRQKSDPIFQMGWIIVSLQRDLMLFENQIPFFVLLKLFDLIEVPDPERFAYRLFKFFNTLFPGNLNRDFMEVISLQQEIKHLLHLIHCCCEPLNINQAKEESEKRPRFIYSVAGLREANVMFEEKGNTTVFDIEFKNGTMYIAPLTIEDRTEAFFRNLIVYEQYADRGESSPVTDYVRLLDCLVDSSKDVEILSRLGILENWLGDDEVVAKMVNKLNYLITNPSNFTYASIFASVNEHFRKRRNRWMAKLRRNYLNSPWAIISIVGALALLLLTVTQTVFSVL
ncbi:hypothetical protein C2S51_003423 [Perilla frutescens var. frutescens]|nr:hypothetical protein C2S51_003423 [Perilla frutescens var. frutescens]